jgi:hypothetical protein
LYRTIAIAPDRLPSGAIIVPQNAFAAENARGLPGKKPACLQSSKDGTMCLPCEIPESLPFEQSDSSSFAARQKLNR